MKFTPDIIVAGGLVVALILSIVLGGDTTLQTNIAAGLTGYLGRSIVDRTSPPATTEMKAPPVTATTKGELAS